MMLLHVTLYTEADSDW